MPESDVVVVLAHAAWADGSSWDKVIGGLRSAGVKSVAAPLPLTTLADDVAALDRTLERVEGPVVVAGHAYAGAVIASTRDEKVASLVYVTALAPDEGETVGDVYYWAEHHPQAPALGPDRHGLIWLPEEAFGRAVAEEDRMIPAETQRFMAERMKARVRMAAADHVPMITKASAIVDILLEAVREIESSRKKENSRG
jgi:pimeloyl-ACP methyl ester carboxylesterase